MVYIFECEKCKKQQEIEISISVYDSEKEKQFCKCGEKMKRVFTPIGTTIYNCGGFYDTDIRKVGSR